MKRVAQLVLNLFSRKVHVSWLIAAVCVGILIGTVLSFALGNGVFSLPIFLIFAIVSAALALVSRLRIMIILAVVAGILFGLWRGTLVAIDLTAYDEWLGKNVVLRGKVSADPDYSSSLELRLRLVDVEIIATEEYEFLSSEGKDFEQYLTEVPGQVWVSTRTAGDEIKRSDVVEVGGTLRAGFGTFPASISFASIREISRSLGADPMRDLRDNFRGQLAKVIDEPELNLGMGILAGQKTALPADLAAAFIAASLTHIVVASGYNLMILVRLARRLFAKISRFAALVLGGGLIICFAGVTGFSPSMTRAALVAGLSLAAWYYGRKFHPITLIFLVAAITVVANPMVIIGDVGWWLSFTSFVGVIILAPLIKNYFWGQEKIFGIPFIQRIKFGLRKFFKKSSVEPEKSEKQFNIRQIFIETMSAQVMAMPIIMLTMGQFSPYGLLSNLLVLPLIPLTMLTTFVAGMSAFFLPLALAQIIAVPAELLLGWVIGVANWAVELPGATQNISISLMTCVVIFIVILLIIFYLKRKTNHNFYGDNVIE